MHQPEEQAQFIASEQIIYNPSPYPMPNTFNNMNYIQPHFMPEPTTAPWNLQEMPWNIATTTVTNTADNVMQFQGKSEADILEHRLNTLHHKRKSDIIPELPAKQFISEEKFTAHFNGLHISSDFINSNIEDINYQNDTADEEMGNSKATGGSAASGGGAVGGVCFTNRTYQDYETTAQALKERLMKANRLTICDEVKKLCDEQYNTTFLQKALKHRPASPCKALVLWKPLTFPFVKENSNSSDDSDDEDEKKNDNKNAKKEENKDTNLIDFEEIGSSDFDDVEIADEDFVDNNNSSNIDLNTVDQVGMDEDL